VGRQWRRAFVKRRVLITPGVSALEADVPCATHPARGPARAIVARCPGTRNTLRRFDISKGKKSKPCALATLMRKRGQLRPLRLQLIGQFEAMTFAARG
jgi:hypothetical protein